MRWNQLSKVHDDASERIRRIAARLEASTEPLLQPCENTELLDTLLESAIALTEADFGNVQVYEQDGRPLRIVAQRGFAAWWIDFWNDMTARHGSCGLAMAEGRRVVVEDVTQSALFTTELLAVQLRAEVRAVQSTPMLSVMGTPWGVVSTHFKRAGAPHEESLWLLDSLLRQVAEVHERRQVLLAMHSAEARAQSALEHSDDATLSFSIERRILQCNRRTERAFGLLSHEIIGRDFLELVPVRSRAAVRQFLADVFRAGGTARVADSPLTHGLHRERGEFPCRMRLSSLRSSGQLVVTVSVQDLTQALRDEAKRRILDEVGATLLSEDQARALTALLEILTRELSDFAGLALVDSRGVMARASVVSRDPTRTWVAQQLIDLSEAAPRRSHPALRAARRRKTVVINLLEGRIERLARTSAEAAAIMAARPVSLIFIPVMHGSECVAVLGLSRSTKQFDDHDLTLAEEIARLCTPLIDSVHLQARATEALHARDEVLGIVAHDLRNPLNTIVLQARRLQRERGDGGAAQAIGVAAQRMDRILRDLLDVTRTELGHLHVEPRMVVAADLIRDAATTLQEQVQESGLVLMRDVEDASARVWADPARIMQVFENLVGNALKFTEHGAITLGANAHVDEVHFSVVDTGCGIHERDLPHLFERFWQKTRQVHQGAGLGLTIVKAIIEAHEGRVWAESKVGGGSTFYFSLPTRPKSQSALTPVVLPTT